MIKMKPLKIIKPKKMDLIPMKFGNTRKTKIPKKPNKKLTYKKAFKIYDIKPFGDWDKDNVPNWKDCRPFDRFKHAIVPKGFENKKVDSFTKPSTYKEIYQDTEIMIPDIFGKGRPTEAEYSDRLHGSLLDREDVKNSPFKNLVGVYTIDVQMPAGQTQLIHHYLSRYLEVRYPNKKFNFSIDNPSKVDVVDYDINKGLLNSISYKTYKTPYEKLGPKEKAYVDDTAKQSASKGRISKDKKISSYLGDAPKYVTDLLKHLVPRYRKVKIWITDYPVDVLMKSTWPKNPKTGERPWSSCETLTGQFDRGPFHDVALRNAVVYFYYTGEPKKSTPTARVMLRWGETMGGKIGIGIESDVYPFTKRSETLDEGDALRQALQLFLQKKGYVTEKITTPYRYEGYSDTAGGSGRIVYRPYDVRDIGLEKDLHAFKIGFTLEQKIPESLEYHLVHQETSPDIAIRMIGRRDLSEESIGHYAKSDTVRYRQETAKKSRLPSSAMYTFSGDPEISVRRTLVSSQPAKKFTSKISKRVLTSPGNKDELYHEFVPTLLHKSDRKRVTKDLAEFIIKKGNISDMTELAKTPGLHKDIVKKLSAVDSYSVVEGLLASNSDKIPDNALIDYINSGNLDFVKAMSKNAGSLSLPVLKRIVKSGNKTALKNIVIMEGEIPLTIQNDIARTTDSYTQNLLAARPDLSYKAGLVLSDTGDDVILSSLVNNSEFFKRLFNIKKKYRDDILYNVVANYSSVDEIPERITTKVKLPHNIVAKLVERVSSNWAVEELSQNKSLSPESYQLLYETARERNSVFALSKLFNNKNVSKTMKKALYDEYGDSLLEKR